MNRPAAGEPPADLRVLPDFGDALLYELNRLDELLLTLGMWETEDDIELPAPFANKAALMAFGAVYDAVAPTQSRDEANPLPGRLYGPDGRFEHTPLRFVVVDAEQLAVLDHAAQVLAAPHLAHELDEALHEHTQSNVCDRADLIGSFSRLTSVLGLVWDDDVRALWAAVATQPAGVDVTLDAQQESAYARLADRINRLWRYGSPLDRFLY